MMGAMDVNIAIVEDNADICTEMEALLAEDPRCHCVAVCRNMRSAMRRIPPRRPHVVIMDIKLPDGSGIDAVKRLRRLLPETQFMMFTIFEDSEQIFRALEAGASGYLLKRSAPEELVGAVHEIMKGGVPMTGDVARRVIRSFRRTGTPEIEQLTPREEEILQLLAKGLRSKEISRDLEISIETVNSHLKHIYEKLHVRTRTEAVIKYLG